MLCSNLMLCNNLLMFSYSYTVVAFAQFPVVMIFEDTLLFSGHVMDAFDAPFSEIGQI